MTFYHKESHSNPYLHKYFHNKGWLKLNNFLIPKTPWCIGLQTVGNIAKWILCCIWRSHTRSPSKSSPIKQGIYFKFWKRNVAFTCIYLVCLSISIYLYIFTFSRVTKWYLYSISTKKKNSNLKKKKTHFHSSYWVLYKEKINKKTKRNKARMQDSWPQLKSCLVMKKLSFVLLGVFHFLLHQICHLSNFFFLLYFGYFTNFFRLILWLL